MTKEHKRAIAKGAWSPAAKAKRAATLAAKRAMKEQEQPTRGTRSANQVGDTLVYLKYAAEDVLAEFRKGVSLKTLRKSQLLVLLAYKELEAK